MFTLKVDWKKRLIIGLINIIPMLALCIVFFIFSIKKDIPDGGIVIIVCFIVYLLGVKDILFFEKNKMRRLDYMGGKTEDKWKPDTVSTLIRTVCFSIVLIYFLLVLIFG